MKKKCYNLNQQELEICALSLVEKLNDCKINVEFIGLILDYTDIDLSEIRLLVNNNNNDLCKKILSLAYERYFNPEYKIITKFSKVGNEPQLLKDIDDIRKRNITRMIQVLKSGLN